MDAGSASVKTLAALIWVFCELKGSGRTAAEPAEC